MYGYKKGKKKERSKTSLNSLARNARTFRKLSLSVRCIQRFTFLLIFLLSNSFESFFYTLNYI